MATTDYKGGYADGKIDALDDVVDFLTNLLDEDITPIDVVDAVQEYKDALDEKVDSLRRDRD